MHFCDFIAVLFRVYIVCPLSVLLPVLANKDVHKHLYILQNSASVLNFSKRAFCHASPTVWNSLPQTVISDLTVTTGTFNNRLKSALYGCAFLQ